MFWLKLTLILLLQRTWNWIKDKDDPEVAFYVTHPHCSGPSSNKTSKDTLRIQPSKPKSPQPENGQIAVARHPL